MSIPSAAGRPTQCLIHRSERVVTVVEMPMRVALLRAIPVRAYPLVIGFIALVLTVSMTIPFASILIGAVLLRRDRWKEIVVVSSLGSATGGLILYLSFHYLGWDPDRRRLSGPDAIKGLVRRDAMGYRLWHLGTAWHCRDAHAANPGPYLHRNVAVADFRSLPRTLFRKTAEIRRLWLARCRVSVLV
jgi:hypothetical protein